MADSSPETCPKHRQNLVQGAVKRLVALHHIETVRLILIVTLFIIGLFVSNFRAVEVLVGVS